MSLVALRPETSRNGEDTVEDSNGMIEAPLDNVHRLLDMLESISVEKSWLIKTRDFAATSNLQARENSVLERLAELVRIPGIREAFDSIWENRFLGTSVMHPRNSGLLLARMAQIRAQLRT